MPVSQILQAVALALLVTVGAPTAGEAQAASDDAAGPDRAAIEALIDQWYAENCASAAGRPDRLLAPGAIDASPGFIFRDTGSAALGPQVFVSLASTATLFRYEVIRVRADARFARVDVRERGYTYASAAARTYERRGEALLILERQDDGSWRVLAHRSQTVGFPPSLATTRMPDLAPGADGPQPRCARLGADDPAG